MLLGPTQNLAVPPGRRGFLGVLPRPGASRLPVRCPSDPRSSHPCPCEPESACASYPAHRPAYRSAWRVATSSSTCPVPVVRHPPLRASGCAGTVLRYFPQVHCRLIFICAGLQQVPLDSPSEPSPCGFDPAVRNPLPSPRASSYFQDLSEPTYSYKISSSFRQGLFS